MYHFGLLGTRFTGRRPVEVARFRAGAQDTWAGAEEGGLVSLKIFRGDLIAV